MTKRPVAGLVGEVVVATSKLITLLELEVENLKRGDVQALTASRTEKGRLLRSYESKLHALKAAPALFASVEPAVKSELETATKSLQRAIETNVSRLRAAAEANRRLVDAIARAAAETNACPGYGPNHNSTYGPGMVSAPVASSRMAAQPISVRRAL